MKTKLLKKLRRNFLVVYSRQVNRWYIFDYKNHTSYAYTELYTVMRSLLSLCGYFRLERKYRLKVGRRVYKSVTNANWVTIRKQK